MLHVLKSLISEILLNNAARSVRLTSSQYL